MKAVYINREAGCGSVEQTLSSLLGLYGVKVDIIGRYPSGGVKRRVVLNDATCGCEESQELRHLLDEEAPHLTLVEAEECDECLNTFDPEDLVDHVCLQCRKDLDDADEEDR